MPVANTFVIPYRKRLRSPEKDDEVPIADSPKRQRPLHYQSQKDHKDDYNVLRGTNPPPLGKSSTTKHRRQLLDSLVEQTDVCADAIKTPALRTCEWILNHAGYLRWRDPGCLPQHYGLFWINGPSGTGKSTMMKFLYLRLRKNAESSSSESVISYFPNTSGSASSTSLVGVYRSLLLQILIIFRDLQEVLDDIDQLPRDENGQPNWSVQILQSTISAAVQRLEQRKLTCFVDTLERCEQGQVQEMVDFFATLGKEASLKGIKLYICFSSPTWVDFKCEGQVLPLQEQEEHIQDIEKFIRQELRIGIGERVDVIQEQIQQKSTGVFLWAALVIATLNVEFGGWDLLAVEQKMADLPSGLPELLTTIFKQHKSNEDEFLLCVQWLLFAKRSLDIEELYLAITSGLDTRPRSVAWSLQRDRKFRVRKFILKICYGLARVNEGGKVILLHESIKSFLIKHGGARLLWPNIADFEAHAHNTLKECCVRYMDAQMLNATFLPYAKVKFHGDNTSYIRQRALADFPLVTYACQNTLYHADAAAEDISQETFLRSFDLEAWIKAYNFLERDKSRHYTLAANMLYILAEHNYTRLIRTQVDIDPRINFHGQRYNYPLFAAFANGSSAAVRELLRRPMSLMGDSEIPAGLPFKQSFVVPENLAPLQWAVQKAAGPLAALLIASGEFDNNLVDHCGQPLITWAAVHGHKNIVKMLIEEKHVDINTRDNFGNTALSLAVNHVHTSMIRYLLSQPGINVNTQDQAKYSPLLWAAMNGNDDIMDLLLAMEGIEVNILNSLGETPLMCAVEREHIGLTARLLASGNVDVNLQDQCGRTAFSRAVEHGREDIVRALVAIPGIDVNTRNRLGVPPIFEALRRGNLAIADLIRPLL